MRTVTTLAAAVLALVLAESPFAAEGEAPAGPVVLTIAENVANTNRPAYREKLDVIFRYHKRTFDLAFAFDRAMLEGMGTVALRIEHAGWGGPMTVSGPRLADVLKMAGCPGGPLATLALDGFNTEISGEEREAHEWVVATRAEGRPLGLGERGPLWLVFDPPDERPATDEEADQWPWALFFIECKQGRLFRE